MYPILISAGPIVIYAFSVFVILAWLVFSFLFWRSLRNNGVVEEQIFDLTFYCTIIAFIAARVGFIVFHWDAFAGKNPLLLAAVWVAPGFSFTAALLAVVVSLVGFGKWLKIRTGIVLDGLAMALPLTLIIGKIGSLLDGTEIGKVTSSWGVRYLGHPGLRHPIQLYEMLGFIFILSVVIIITRKSFHHKWQYGLIGIWFFLLYAQALFVLEFLKDTHVYWLGLSANQWVYIGIFTVSLCLLYIKARLKLYFLKLVRKSQSFVLARKPKSTDTTQES